MIKRAHVAVALTVALSLAVVTPAAGLFHGVPRPFFGTGHGFGTQFHFNFFVAPAIGKPTNVLANTPGTMYSVGFGTMPLYCSGSAVGEQLLQNFSVKQGFPIKHGRFKHSETVDSGTVTFSGRFTHHNEAAEGTIAAKNINLAGGLTNCGTAPHGNPANLGKPYPWTAKVG